MVCVLGRVEVKYSHPTISCTLLLQRRGVGTDTKTTIFGEGGAKVTAVILRQERQTIEKDISRAQSVQGIIDLSRLQQLGYLHLRK